MTVVAHVHQTQVSVKKECVEDEAQLVIGFCKKHEIIDEPLFKLTALSRLFCNVRNVAIQFTISQRPGTTWFCYVHEKMNLTTPTPDPFSESRAMGPVVCKAHAPPAGPCENLFCGLNLCGEPWEQGKFRRRDLWETDGKQQAGVGDPQKLHWSRQQASGSVNGKRQQSPHQQGDCKAKDWARNLSQPNGAGQWGRTHSAFEEGTRTRLSLTRRKQKPKNRGPPVIDEDWWMVCPALFEGVSWEVMYKKLTTAGQAARDPTIGWKSEATLDDGGQEVE